MNIPVSQLLNALERYNIAHPNPRGYHSIRIYSDGSGYILGPDDSVEEGTGFDNLEDCVKMLVFTKPPSPSETKI